MEMTKLRCPNCGEQFEVDEKGYAAIVQQVRDKEFKKELDRQREMAEADKAQSVKLAVADAMEEKQQDLQKKDAEIAKLKAEVTAAEEAKAAAAKLAQSETEQKYLNQVNEKEIKINELLAKLEAAAKEKKVAEADKEQSVKLAVADAIELKLKDLQEKESEIVRLKAEVAAAKEANAAAARLAESETEQKYQGQMHEKETEINNLKAKLESATKEQELAVTKAEQAAANKMTEMTVQIAALEEKERSYQTEAKLKEQDLKTRMSTKMIGETLEQHCEMSFNQVRSMGFPNAYFEKDNAVSATGSKGDFIFRDFDDTDMEYISIMFEMKNGATCSITSQCSEKIAA